MGSCAPKRDDNERVWKILVTGFGPFLDQHVNPSYLIAQKLPTAYQSADCPPLSIYVNPYPIDVCYKTVRRLIPRLLYSTHASAQDTPGSTHSPDDMHNFAIHDGLTFDIIVHLGLAQGRKYFSFECCANRDGYVKKDIHGESLEGDSYWQDTCGAPGVLRPTFDMVDVWRRWKRASPDEDVRASENAGRYLCEFIFYAGMVEYWRRNPAGKRPSIFCHVPSATEEPDLLKGKKVVLALIVSLVMSEISKEADDHNDQGETEEMRFTDGSDGC